MVYSVDGILKTEAIAAHKCLALMLINKMKREYSDMCGFVQAIIPLAIARSNNLLLCGARYKDAYIRQLPNLEDGSEMTLLEPWQG